MQKRRPEISAGRRNGAIRSTRLPRQKTSPLRRSRRDFKRRKSAREKKSSKESEIRKKRNVRRQLRPLDAKRISKSSVRRPKSYKRLKRQPSADASKKRKERPEKRGEDSKQLKGRNTGHSQESLNQNKTEEGTGDKELRIRRSRGPH